MTGSGRENITVRVTSGIKIDDILSTVEKIDFKRTREKFFDRPIYAQAIRELTPTKPERKGEKEDPKKIQKEPLKNKEEGKKDAKTTENKKETIKPKVVQTIFQTPARN